MTAEEKLTLIRKQAQEEFVHFSNAYHDYYGSLGHAKIEWVRKWMDWIDNLCDENPEFMEDYTGNKREEWEDEASKIAGSIDYSNMRTRIDIFKRGFHEGFYYAKQDKK